MIKRRHLVSLAVLVLAIAPCAADIFRFVDAQGSVHFTNIAGDSRYKLYMKEAPRLPEKTAAAPVQPAPAVAQANLVYRPGSRKEFSDMIVKVAHEHKMDPALIHAVVAVESAYNPTVVSRAGAIGLMQLMPDTAKRYGVTNILDPVQNVTGGTRYLRDLLAMFNNNLRLTIAAYNAGEGAVMKYRRKIPPYAETRAYVPKVLYHYERNRKTSPAVETRAYVPKALFHYEPSRKTSPSVATRAYVPKALFHSERSRKIKVTYRAS
ncbi:MAG TPA: lytic transglycosylase domain-containing protein [Burkholderiales bacterium]|nr:lytic transglycosylase domain-containing protein [Burkholderiales bacterium]